MHRLIMDAPDGLQVDHINHNGLDNRRANLRCCTQSQNQWNRSKSKGDFTSKFKCVRRHKRDKKWYVEPTINGKKVWVGSFDSEQEAARAYNQWAIAHCGEFAQLNDI